MTISQVGSLKEKKKKKMSSRQLGQQVTLLWILIQDRTRLSLGPRAFFREWNIWRMLNIWPWKLWTKNRKKERKVISSDSMTYPFTSFRFKLARIWIYQDLGFQKYFGFARVLQKTGHASTAYCAFSLHSGRVI